MKYVCMMFKKNNNKNHTLKIYYIADTAILVLIHGIMAQMYNVIAHSLYCYQTKIK